MIDTYGRTFHAHVSGILNMAFRESLWGLCYKTEDEVAQAVAALESAWATEREWFVEWLISAKEQGYDVGDPLTWLARFKDKIDV